MSRRFNDCLEKGLLRKIPASKDNAERSIKRAEIWLKEAKKTLDSNAYDSSVLSSYLVMFHSARAILFHDGYREKSHACVARYLEEKYAKGNLIEKKWIDLLDHQRSIRHDNQYDLSFFASDKEAINAVEAAALFLTRMRKLLTHIKKSE